MPLLFQPFWSNIAIFWFLNLKSVRKYQKMAIPKVLLSKMYKQIFSKLWKLALSTINDSHYLTTSCKQERDIGIKKKKMCWNSNYLPYEPFYTEYFCAKKKLILYVTLSPKSFYEKSQYFGFFIVFVIISIFYLEHRHSSRIGLQNQWT